MKTLYFLLLIKYTFFNLKRLMYNKCFRDNYVKDLNISMIIYQTFNCTV